MKDIAQAVCIARSVYCELVLNLISEGFSLAALSFICLCI